MKYFIVIIILILNTFIYAQTLYYKNVNTAEEDSDLMQVKFPEDCLEIIEISNDNSLEFKNNNVVEKIVSECNAFLKGKKVKNTFKSSSDKILDTSKKVKEGLKTGTESFIDSVAKDTNLIIDDTVEITDGIVSGTGKIISGTGKIISATVEKGTKITSGVSSFFKGVFSSEN